MQHIFDRLDKEVKQIACHCAVIEQNHLAMQARLGDILEAIERQNRAGHIEFSLFTPESGRA